MERAYSHQVYPLVYRNLLDLGFPGVPEAVQSELKGLYLANALRNQLLAEELARVLSCWATPEYVSFHLRASPWRSHSSGIRLPGSVSTSIFLSPPGRYCVRDV